LNVPLGLEIILDTPMELQDDLGHVESRFGLFGDAVNLSVRWVHGLRQTIGSQVVLDTPNGTPS
jgi:hypothetical protein